MPDLFATLEPGHPSRSYKLLGILQSYAPTADIQMRCTEVYNWTIGEGVSEVAVETMLVGMMADGLKYGNWPWVIGWPAPDSSTD